MNIKTITKSIIVVNILLFFIPKTVSAFDYLKFAAGIGGGYIIHELSHQAMADLTHTNLKWDNGFGNNWTIPKDTNKKQRVFIGGAGLASQIISTEIILNTKIKKSNEYVLGILTFNILNAVLYPILDERDNSEIGFGDVEMMDKAGLDKDYVTAFIVAHSLYSIYRIYYKTDIPIFLAISKNEVKFGITIYKW